MTEELLPPLSALGNVIVEVFGPSPGTARWDEALWDTSVWAVYTWQDVTPLSMVVQVTWGVDDPAGVLSVPAAGSWDINTYDPERKLDPSNGASPYAVSLKPGRPIRVSVREPGKPAPGTIRTGVIDEVEYNLRDAIGALRGTDVVPLIVAAKVPASTNLASAPTTLRARARWLLAQVGLDKLVPVEPDQADPNEPVVVNPDFETGSPEPWQIYPSSNMGNDTHYWSTQGSWHLVLHGAGGWAECTQYVAGQAGKQYVFDALVGNAPGFLFVDWWDENGNAVGTASSLYFDRILPPAQRLSFTTSPAPEGTARVRVLVANVGTTSDLLVVDDIHFRLANPNTYDPPVGPLPDEKDASVWSLIATSAFDALHALWIDRFGTMRFRSFGDPQDHGFTVGGEAGIPISTLSANASIADVYTLIRAFDQTAPDNPVLSGNVAAQEIYGIITLTRDKPVPDAQRWADSVRDDRAGAGLQYETGTLYPRTFAELMSIINLEMVDIMHVVADDVVPPLNVAARILGVKIIADTGTGWTAEVKSYIPAKEWSDAEQPVPPEPEEPPPGTTTSVVRYYDANKDSRAGRDSSGTNLGSGTEGELPVGAWSGWRNRSFIGFPSIPFGDVVSVDKCELELDTSTQVNVGFGSSPKVVVQRVTQSWSEGTSSSPSGSNALKYPGPSVSSTDSKTASITRSENAAVSIDITGIARAWFAGSAQYGVGLFSAGEDSTTYTTEFWSRENATASRRPRLKLTATVRI